MCHLTIAIDQSVHTMSPVFDLIDASTFYIRSIRVVPVASSRKADLYLSLGGGSMTEMDSLVSRMRSLPAVQSTHHTIPPVWISDMRAER